MEGRQVVIEPIRKYFHELGKKANEDETKWWEGQDSFWRGLPNFNFSI